MYKAKCKYGNLKILSKLFTSNLSNHVPFLYRRTKQKLTRDLVNKLSKLSPDDFNNIFRYYTTRRREFLDYMEPAA